MNKIDIIIPCYKATETLAQALSSIAIQSVVNDIKVHVVVDGDGLYNQYVDIANIFSNFLYIDVYGYEKNMGVGFARQFGIDNSNSELIMFLDADDTFAGAYAVEMLRGKLLSEPKAVVCVGNFFEKRKDMSFVAHRNDLIWLHGKIYKREFLNKWGIRFNNSSANEDVGFNTKVRLMENEDERIIYLDNLIYYWHFNEKGITRANNFDYTYNKSFVGYVDNMIDAIEFAKQKLPNEVYIEEYAIETLAELWLYYLRTKYHKPEYAEQGLKKVKEYQEKIIRKYHIFIKNFDLVNDIVSGTLEKNITNMRGIVIDLTFWQFLDLINYKIIAH